VQVDRCLCCSPWALLTDFCQLSKRIWIAASTRTRTKRRECFICCRASMPKCVYIPGIWRVFASALPLNANISPGTPGCGTFHCERREPRTPFGCSGTRQHTALWIIPRTKIFARRVTVCTLKDHNLLPWPISFEKPFATFWMLMLLNKCTQKLLLYVVKIDLKSVKSNISIYNVR
jgi:hypothetical protein